MAELNLIIDIPASREAGQVMFWGVAETVTTPDPERAMVVSTEQLNKKLDRFDNGSTTQAVLKAAVDEAKDRVDYLLNFSLKEQAA